MSRSFFLFVLRILAGSFLWNLEAGGAEAQVVSSSDPSQILFAELRGSTENGLDTSSQKEQRRKPQDPRLKYKGRARQARVPLPPLRLYPTAPAVVKREDPERVAAMGAPPVAYAQVEGIPAKPKIRVEEDPFAPVGLNWGGLRVTPSAETSAGYDSNPNRSATPEHGSSVIREEIGVGVKSLWNSHDLQMQLRGAYSAYPQAREASRPDGDGKMTLRLDATKETAVDVELRGGLSTQRPGAPGVPGSIEGQPLVLSTGSTLGITQTAGRFILGLHGSLDHVNYEDAHTVGGPDVAFSRNNYSTYGLQAKVAYEITPEVVPFVQGDIDQRRYDQTLDLSGFNRRSNGQAVRIGTKIDSRDFLSGTVSVGYMQRQYEDPGLSDIRGPLLDGALVWTVSPLTRVTLQGSTEMDETSVASATGVLVQKASLEVAHALLRNLILKGLIGFQESNYKGISLKEKTVIGDFSIEYKLNRSFALKASYRREQLNSTLPSSDYKANIFLLSLRLQR